MNCKQHRRCAPSGSNGSGLRKQRLMMVQVLLPRETERLRERSGLRCEVWLHPNPSSASSSLVPLEHMPGLWWMPALPGLSAAAITTQLPKALAATLDPEEISMPCKEHAREVRGEGDPRATRVLPCRHTFSQYQMWPQTLSSQVYPKLRVKKKMIERKGGREWQSVSKETGLDFYVRIWEKLKFVLKRSYYGKLDLLLEAGNSWFWDSSRRDPQVALDSTSPPQLCLRVTKETAISLIQSHLCVKRTNARGNMLYDDIFLSTIYFHLNILHSLRRSFPSRLWVKIC